MSAEHRRRIGVLGLGPMGSGMAHRLAPVHDLSVFDPDSARCDAAVRLGATRARTAAEATEGVEAALVAVRDASQLDAAVFGPHGAIEGLAPGTDVIVTATIGPEAMRAFAERARERGIVAIDAPVSGGPQRAADGELLIMVGASDAAVARVQPILALLASTVAHVGPRVGDGQALKVVNQLLCGVHIAAAAEALALAERLGLDLAGALDALTKGAAASFMLGDRGKRMIGERPAEVRSRVDIFVKDMTIVQEVAAQHDMTLSIASAAKDLYQAAARAGLGAVDDAELIDLLR